MAKYDIRGHECDIGDHRPQVAIEVNVDESTPVGRVVDRYRVVVNTTSVSGFSVERVCGRDAMGAPTWKSCEFPDQRFLAFALAVSLGDRRLAVGRCDSGGYVVESDSGRPVDVSPPPSPMSRCRSGELRWAGCESCVPADPDGGCVLRCRSAPPAPPTLLDVPRRLTFEPKGPFTSITLRGTDQHGRPVSETVPFPDPLPVDESAPPASRFDDIPLPDPDDMYGATDGFPCSDFPPVED